MRIEPEINSAAIVLRGNFNPAIFTPAWFEFTGLLPKGTGESAAVSLIHPKVAEFTADWLYLQVTQEQFIVSTSKEPFVRLRDLVVRLFRERLQHTPLQMLGINRAVHFATGSIAARDRICRTLAPVEPWAGCGLDFGADGTKGGMSSLTMTRTAPEDRPNTDEFNIKVEKSTAIAEKRFGVHVDINDHYAGNDLESRSKGRLMFCMESNFDRSMRQSGRFIDHVMSLASDSTDRA